MTSSINAGPFQWEVEIPILTHPMVVRQGLFVLGASGGFLMVLLVGITLFDGDLSTIPVMILIAFLTTGFLALLMVMAVLLFFRNRFRVRYTVNREGILYESIVSPRARRFNRLGILLALLAKNPTVAGAGILAETRENQFMAWKDVMSFREDLKRNSLMLHNHWRPVMLVACRGEEYGIMRDLAEKWTAANHRRREAEKRKEERWESSQEKGREEKSLAGRMAGTGGILLGVVFLLNLPFWYRPFEWLIILMGIGALGAVWLSPKLGMLVTLSGAGLALQTGAMLLTPRRRWLYTDATFRIIDTIHGEEWLVVIGAVIVMGGMAVWGFWRFRKEKRLRQQQSSDGQRKG